MLEIFGEHTLSAAEILGLLAISLALIAGYGLHATRIRYPLLQLGLFRIRTFSAAVSGSFFTRLGIGGVPFLLPLLYQMGLGFTPIQSGLLIMPQAMAAMSTKFLMPRILTRVGYRGVLISNTVILGAAADAVCDHRAAHAGMADRAAGVLLRGIHLAAIYQHEHAGVCRHQRGANQQRQFHCQHDAADVDQLRRRGRRVGHGVLHSRPRASNPSEMIHGIHLAFIALGLFTILSTAVFVP